MGAIVNTVNKSVGNDAITSNVNQLKTIEVLRNNSVKCLEYGSEVCPIVGEFKNAVKGVGKKDANKICLNGSLLALAFVHTGATQSNLKIGIKGNMMTSVCELSSLSAAR